MMYCVNCENPVTYDDKAARKCPHCGNDPAHEARKAAIAGHRHVTENGKPVSHRVVVCGDCKKRVLIDESNVVESHTLSDGDKCEWSGKSIGILH